MISQRAGIFILLAVAVGVSACGRGEETDLQNSDAPVMPVPSEPIPTTPDNEFTMNEIKGSPGTMRDCASSWDPGVMWSLMQSSLHSGYYQPYPMSYDATLPAVRGFRGKDSRGFGCMNRLLSLISQLSSYRDYYSPGALGGWLQNSWAWAYRSPFYYGDSNSTSVTNR